MGGILVKFLKKLDKGVDAAVKYFTSALMILLTIIVNAMVFSRYVLRVNLGGIEELPVFFMCICIWMGAIRVMRDDKMVKIEIIFSLVKNERAQAALNMVASLVSCAVMAFCCTRAYLFVYRTWRDGIITPSLGWPAWLVYVFSLIGSVGMTVYAFVNTIKYARKVVGK